MRTAFVSLLLLCLMGVLDDARAQPFAHVAPYTTGGAGFPSGATFQTYVAVGLTAIGRLENTSRTQSMVFGPWPLYALMRRQDDTGTPVESLDVPASFRLDANYPNPFNPATTIHFNVAEPVHTRLTVYDALGRTVAVLLDGHCAPGTYTVSFDAGGLPSGAYLYRLDAGPYHKTRPMLLLK